MTLAKRIVLKTVFLTIALAAAGLGMVTGMLALQEMTASTREEFEELREVRSVDRHLQAAIRHASVGDAAAVRSELSSAISGLGEFEAYQDQAPSEFGAEHATTEKQLGMRSLSVLHRALVRLDATTSANAWAPAVEVDLEQATRTLDQLTDVIETAVAAVHAQTAERFRTMTWWLFLLALASVGAGLLISILHYRSVVAPLRELRAGTERLARRELGTRLDLRGDREFSDLKRSFNNMAAELESLCNHLEQRVAQQSKELAMAERLASVGYLAAGVAHEINNPLAIMSGYAESLLRRLRDGAVTAPPEGDWVSDLEVIRDEAFRCKRITQSLLDLSRMGDTHREAVSLRAVVEACIRLLRSWSGCGNTRITMQPAGGDACLVSGSEPELRQVVLNLLANAVEATSTGHGQVVASLSNQDGWITLRISDNGCGMSADTLDRVFEPFFTTGKGRGGLGLGLSISHAIARRQDGVLTAHSDGPSRGSAFELRLPAYQEAARERQ